MRYLVTLLSIAFLVSLVLVFVGPTKPLTLPSNPATQQALPKAEAPVPLWPEGLTDSPYDGQISECLALQQEVLSLMEPTGGPVNLKDKEPIWCKSIVTGMLSTYDKNGSVTLEVETSTLEGVSILALVQGDTDMTRQAINYIEYSFGIGDSIELRMVPVLAWQNREGDSRETVIMVALIDIKIHRNCHHYNGGKSYIPPKKADSIIDALFE